MVRRAEGRANLKMNCNFNLYKDILRAPGGQRFRRGDGIWRAALKGVSLAYIRRRNRLAASRWGNSFSSARNSAEWTQRRLPRNRTGCLRCNIS